MFDKYAKAIVAALVAGLGAYATAVSDGSVTAQEWAGVAIALLAGLGLVWATPNAPKE